MAYRPRARIWTLAPLTDGAVGLEDLKSHLRVTHSDEDALIMSYGMAATRRFEMDAQRVIEARQAVLLLPCLPSGVTPIELPGGNVVSVTSVIADGVAITGCTAVGHSPALLLPASDWPATTGSGYPVAITYQVGMTAIPQDITHAIMVAVAEMFAHREDVIEGQINSVPMNFASVAESYRIWPAA